MISELLNEPVHDKTYNKTCVTSEDSDQSSLIPCTVSSTAPGYPKRDKRGPLSYLVDVQADLSLYCHTDLIVGFVVLAQLFFLKEVLCLTHMYLTNHN